jgi:hypothetical protein
MKKLGLLLLVLTLGFSVTAQAAMRIGVETNSVPGGFATIATLGTDFSQTMSGDLGLALATNAAGENANIGILGRIEWKVMRMGQLTARAGGNLMLATNPNYVADGDSLISLNGFAGVEYFVTSNFSVLADLVLLSLSTQGNDTSFSLLSGGAYAGPSTFTI